MNGKTLNQQIVRQLSLINFDRSTPLLEQQVKSDRLGSGGQFNPILPNKNMSIKQQTELNDSTVAKKAFLIIKKEVDGGYMPWMWGTDESAILDALKTIKNKNQYDKLLKLIHKNYEESTGLTILQFLQSQEFSLGADPLTRTLLGGGPTGLGQDIQYEYNDKWLIEFEKILSKFNPNEKYEYESMFSSKDETTNQLRAVIPPYSREVLHLAIPGVSILMAILSGGVLSPTAAWLAGASIELLDVAVYYFVDDDPYLAGLGAIFALVPGGTLLGKYIGRMSKNVFISFLKKIGLWRTGKIGSEAFEQEERRALNEFIENQTMYQRLAYQTAAKSFINRLLIKTAGSLQKTAELIVWLVKKGILPAKFLTEFGITMVGGFASWDYIASTMKICRSMYLEDLKKSKTELVKLLGSLSEEVLVFAERCDSKEKQEIMNQIKYTLENLKGIVTATLLDLIESDFVFEESKYNNVFLYEVAYIQYILKELEITSKTKPTYYFYDNKTKNLKVEGTESVENVSVYNFAGRLMKSTDNDGKSNMNVDFSKFSEGVYIVYITFDDNTKRAIKLFSLKDKSVSGVYNTGSVNETFKWGYYDNYTKKIVEAYQKKKGLSVDGVCGSNTLKMLLSDANKMSSIENFGNLPLDGKALERARKQAIEIIKKNQETFDNLSTKVSPRMLEEEYQKQKNKVQEDTFKELEKMDLDENDLQELEDRLDS